MRSSDAPFGQGRAHVDCDQQEQKISKPGFAQVDDLANLHSITGNQPAVHV
jgi:hypothetical protein